MALAIILGEEYCVDFQYTLLEEPKGGGTILHLPVMGGNFLMFGLKGNYSEKYNFVNNTCVHTNK